MHDTEYKFICTIAIYYLGNISQEGVLIFSATSWPRVRGHIAFIQQF